MCAQTIRGARLCVFVAAIVLLASVNIPAQQLDAATKQKADELVDRVMQQTGVPSVQVGVIRGDQVVYEVARGEARIATADKAPVAATVPDALPDWFGLQAVHRGLHPASSGTGKAPSR